jgi:hypothetical protein
LSWRIPVELNVKILEDLVLEWCRMLFPVQLMGLTDIYILAG